MYVLVILANVCWHTVFSRFLVYVTVLLNDFLLSRHHTLLFYIGLLLEANPLSPPESLTYNSLQS
jgi:hypothetical protein